MKGETRQRLAGRECRPSPMPAIQADDGKIASPGCRWKALQAYRFASRRRRKRLWLAAEKT